jgi:hypothetical protein
MSKEIKQPTIEQQSKLNDIISDSAESVAIPGTNKSYPVRWIKWGTRRKITRIMHGKKDTDDLLFIHKIAACIILNGYWRILFFFPFLWRWFAYIKQYGEYQLSPIIEAGKKKVPAETFYLSTISAIAMKDLAMTMTKSEAERILREQLTDQGTRRAKKERG